MKRGKSQLQPVDQCDYMAGCSHRQRIQILLLLFNIAMMSAMCFVKQPWPVVAALAVIHVAVLAPCLRLCVPETKTAHTNISLAKLYRAMLIKAWVFWSMPFVASSLSLAFGCWKGKDFAFLAIVGICVFAAYFGSKTTGYAYINAKTYQTGSFGYRVSNVVNFALWYILGIAPILFYCFGGAA